MLFLQGIARVAIPCCKLLQRLAKLLKAYDTLRESHKGSGAAPEHLRSRRQGSLLDRRHSHALLREDLGVICELLRNTVEPSEGSGAVVAVNKLDVVEKVGVDKLEGSDAAGQDKIIAVGHEIADTLADDLVGAEYRELPLHRRNHDGAAARFADSSKSLGGKRFDAIVAQEHRIAPFPAFNIPHVKKLSNSLSASHETVVGFWSPPQIHVVWR